MTVEAAAAEEEEDGLVLPPPKREDNVKVPLFFGVVPSEDSVWRIINFLLILLSFTWLVVPIVWEEVLGLIRKAASVGPHLVTNNNVITAILTA